MTVINWASFFLFCLSWEGSGFSCKVLFLLPALKSLTALGSCCPAFTHLHTPRLTSASLLTHKSFTSSFLLHADGIILLLGLLGNSNTFLFCFAFVVFFLTHLIAEHCYARNRGRCVRLAVTFAQLSIFWARLTLADWAPHRIAALANEPSLNIVKLACNGSGSRPGAIDRRLCWKRSQTLQL